MKTKIKTFVKKFLVSSCVLLTVSSLIAFGLIKLSVWIDNLIPVYIVPSVNVPSKKPLTMKEWVMKEVAKAGIDTEIAECVIKNESDWANDCNANTNLSTDCGIWRINSIHKKTISFQDRLDYKKATAWSINKIKKEGFNAWVAYSKCSHLAKK